MVWRLVRAQHGVVTRRQLLDLGFSAKAIDHRRECGRLHPAPWRGVYAVGRPDLTREALLMAAVLACGEHAVVSHASAAALWGIRPQRSGPIEVSAPGDHQRTGIRSHRRSLTEGDITEHRRIPVTTPVCTLIDMAARLKPKQTERCVNEADKLDLVDPDALRAELDRTPPRPGVRPLRSILDVRTFALTDSQAEQYFLSIARRAGLPKPLTRERVTGFDVDFWWPELGLVVEIDGLRYHRTPAEQARDRLRDQAHTAAGLTPLRFTPAQVRLEPAYVKKTLVAVAARLQSGRPPGT